MTRMAISPRLATRMLRIRCDMEGFTLRSTAGTCREVPRRASAASCFDHSCFGGDHVAPAYPPARHPGARRHRARQRRTAPGGRASDRHRHPRRRRRHRAAHMTPEHEASYRAGLGAALDAGYAVLERGGSSLDAVAAAVRIMEDDPQFNAGRGAVLNHDGICELDAAIMDGAAVRAGAVAGRAPREEPDRSGPARHGQVLARAARRPGRRGVRARAGRGTGARELLSDAPARAASSRREARRRDPRASRTASRQALRPEGHGDRRRGGARRPGSISPRPPRPAA